MDSLIEIILVNYLINSRLYGHSSVSPPLGVLPVFCCVLSGPATPSRRLQLIFYVFELTFQPHYGGFVVGLIVKFGLFQAQVEGP